MAKYRIGLCGRAAIADGKSNSLYLMLRRLLERIEASHFELFVFKLIPDQRSSGGRAMSI